MPVTEPKRLLTALRKVLMPYDHIGSPESAEEMLRLYIEAVDGFDVELIEDAASMFTRGEVPNHDGRYRPSPATMADACRLAAEKRHRQRYLEQLARPRLPAPLVEKTPESRERVKRMAEKFLRGHSEVSGDGATQVKRPLAGDRLTRNRDSAAAA